jgi:hypothetical protein
MQKGIEETLANLSKMTGKQYGDPTQADRDGFGAVAGLNRITKPIVDATRGPLDELSEKTGRDFIPPTEVARWGARAVSEGLSMLREAEADILEARANNMPGAESLQTYDEVATAARNEMERLQWRASGAGGVASFVGGGGAALTDPEVLLTLPIGAAAGMRTISAVLAEVAIQGGLELSVQLPVQEALKGAGIEPTFSAGGRAATAGIGAGLFTLAGRSAVKALNGAIERGEIKRTSALTEAADDVLDMADMDAVNPYPGGVGRLTFLEATHQAMGDVRAGRAIFTEKITKQADLAREYTDLAVELDEVASAKAAAEVAPARAAEVEAGPALADAEPWQMTRAEYLETRQAVQDELATSGKTTDETAGRTGLTADGQANVRSIHRGLVSAALERGDSVPSRVVADYPDLSAKYADEAPSAGRQADSAVQAIEPMARPGSGRGILRHAKDTLNARGIEASLERGADVDTLTFTINGGTRVIEIPRASNAFEARAAVDAATVRSAQERVPLTKREVEAERFIEPIEKLKRERAERAKMVGKRTQEGVVLNETPDGVQPFKSKKGAAAWAKANLPGEWVAVRVGRGFAAEPADKAARRLVRDSENFALVPAEPPVAVALRREINEVNGFNKASGIGITYDDAIAGQINRARAAKIVREAGPIPEPDPRAMDALDDATLDQFPPELTVRERRIDADGRESFNSRPVAEVIEETDTLSQYMRCRLGE